MASITTLQLAANNVEQLVYKVNELVGRVNSVTIEDDKITISVGDINIANLPTANVVTLKVSNTDVVSGLNADTLDGLDASVFAGNVFVTANYVANSDYTAADILSKLLTVDGDGSGLDADTLDGNESGSFASNTFLTSTYVANVDYTASDVLTKIKTVDGAGSGLNADQLDGFEAGFFLANTTFQTRQIGTSGLASGGGDLSANRNISVPHASQSQAQAGTANTVVMTPLRTQDFLDASDAVKSNVTTTLNVGYTGISDFEGTQSSGTFTPDPTVSNFQSIVNGGAFTLAPPTSICTIIIHISNNASAGSITTTGFTQVTGDSFDTTNGNEFMVYITSNNSKYHLHIVALQ